MQSYQDDQLLQTLEGTDAVSLVKEMPAQATHSVKVGLRVVNGTAEGVPHYIVSNVACEVKI